MTGGRDTLSAQAVPAARTEPGIPGAPGARLVGGAAGHWLTPAVEMAARVSGDWLRRPDFAAMRWASFPDGRARAPGLSASRLCSARDFTTATLRRWRRAERCDDVVVVVSELLTNALLHAQPATGQRGAHWPIQLGLLQPGHCVMCAVTDPSQAVPVPRQPGCFGETSRGLHIVAALSDQWGYVISPEQGKVIWALFG